jgi:hypothetical protein
MEGLRVIEGIEKEWCGVNRGREEWGGIRRYSDRVKKGLDLEACKGIIEVNSGYFRYLSV